MARILIKNGRVWDGARFLDADVLTDGPQIAAIEPQITEQVNMTYDAAGMIVSAGLVDLHGHFRGISPDIHGTSAEMACYPFGVTAAADAGGKQGDGALLDALLPNNAVFAAIDIRKNRPDLETAEARLARYGDHAAGLKLCFDATLAEVWDLAPLKEACTFAHSKKLPVMVHCSHSPVPMAEILEVLDAGDILTHAFHGGENNAAMDDFACIRTAQKRGVVIDVGMAGHIHTNFGVLEQAIRSGIVPDTISTDITKASAYTRGGRYGMTLCMNVAKTLGMQEEDIFKAVTANPAKALKKENRWGSLRVGGPADIALLGTAKEGFDLTDAAGNHIRNQTGYRCVLTVLGGQVVYRD